MRFTENVETIVEERKQPAPRTVTASWPLDRFSPGHSLHVLDQRLECNACHDPTKPDFSKVDAGVCTSCHLEQSGVAHMGNSLAPTPCFDCHAFEFDSDADGPWDCVRCHGPFDAATHTGLAMHDDIACAHCHHPHRPVSETIAECQSCHTGVRLRHGRAARDGACTDCHGGHKLASDAASCMQCHAKEEPQVALSATFGGGHGTCTTCHRPHGFSAASAVDCRGCHAGTVTLAQRAVRAHADCASCHEPHAVRSAGDAACQRCHSEVASTHPETDGQACISCHEPHPARVAQVALRCSSCHAEASSDHAFHAAGATCTGCHEPHAFHVAGMPERQLCRRCHAPQLTLTHRAEGHRRCASCHTGTAHVLTGPVGCESCHEAVLASSPLGHQDCASCHEPHSGGVDATRTCVSCHGVATLPGLHRVEGDAEDPGHMECAACHEVHASRARADRATCMACHEGIADHEPNAKRCTGCHTFISGKRSSL